MHTSIVLMCNLYRRAEAASTSTRYIYGFDQYQVPGIYGSAVYGSEDAVARAAMQCCAAPTRRLPINAPSTRAERRARQDARKAAASVQPNSAPPPLMPSGSEHSDSEPSAGTYTGNDRQPAAPPAAATVSAAAAAGKPVSTPQQRQLARLRSELAAMKLSGLRRRATAAGASVAELEEADDSEAPKDSVAELIVLYECSPTPCPDDANQAVRSELKALKISVSPRPPVACRSTSPSRSNTPRRVVLQELRRRATSAGVGEAELDVAVDAATPQDALVELIVKAMASNERRDAGAVDETVAAVEALRAELQVRRRRCCCSQWPTAPHGFSTMRWIRNCAAAGAENVRAAAARCCGWGG